MINSTNSDYAITNNSELAYVLSKFNEDFIYNTVNLFKINLETMKYLCLIL